MEGLADTGATVSLMRDTNYIKTGGKYEYLKPYTRNITTATDQNLKALGAVDTTMEIGAENYTQHLVIVNGLILNIKKK